MTIFNQFKKTAMTAFLTTLFATPTLADMPTVAMTQIVDHPSLNAISQGVIDGLAEDGFVQDKSVKINREIAQGDFGIATQIAKKFAGDRPDVIIPISTPSAISALTATRGQIPIVFTAVTDPIGAKLVKNFGKTGKNITGISDSIDIPAHFEIIKQIVPNARRIGRIYNPAEENSVSTNKDLQNYIKNSDYVLVEAVATKSSEVLTAARSLVGKVDMIYVAHDNTPVSALEGVIKVAEDNDIPIFAADLFSAERGILAGIGFDEYDMGRQAGKMAAQILKGEKAGEIPVIKMNKLHLAINLDAAKKMGVTLSPEVLNRANQIIGK